MFPPRWRPGCRSHACCWMLPLSSFPLPLLLVAQILELHRHIRSMTSVSGSAAARASTLMGVTAASPTSAPGASPTGDHHHHFPSSQQQQLVQLQHSHSSNGKQRPASAVSTARHRPSTAGRSDARRHGVSSAQGGPTHGGRQAYEASEGSVLRDVRIPKCPHR